MSAKTGTLEWYKLYLYTAIIYNVFIFDFFHKIVFYPIIYVTQNILWLLLTK